MKSILDKSFRYTSAAKTDLKETFKRARKELADEKARIEALELEKIQRTVTPFRRG
jgi:hypothetical protein